MLSPLTSNDWQPLPNPKNSLLSAHFPSDHPLSDHSAHPEESLKPVRISKKPESILRRLALQHPICFSHVHSILDMMGLNESALRNNNFEESFFKTMFYVKTVERVELRKHAIILQLKTVSRTEQPIEYLVERFKSFGDRKFYDLANTIEALVGKVKAEDFGKRLQKSFDAEPLSRFIDSMQGQVYMCRVAPNKLVISRGLLELLGEDPELYALELCKYKMPLKEIISAESYDAIMQKSLENMGLVCDFVNGALTADQLHGQSSLNFSDYLYNKQHKKIYCSLVLFMPTPQMSCVQVREVLAHSEEPKPRCSQSLSQRTLAEQCCQQLRFSEAEVLKQIIRMPEGLLRQNCKKVAGFREVPIS